MIANKIRAWESSKESTLYCQNARKMDENAEMPASKDSLQLSKSTALKGGETRDFMLKTLKVSMSPFLSSKEHRSVSTGKYYERDQRFNDESERERNECQVVLPNEAPNARSKVTLQGEPMPRVEVKPQVKTHVVVRSS